MPYNKATSVPPTPFKPTQKPQGTSEWGHRQAVDGGAAAEVRALVAEALQVLAMGGQAVFKEIALLLATAHNSDLWKTYSEAP